jgi:hypothetical protein
LKVLGKIKSIVPKCVPWRERSDGRVSSHLDNRVLVAGGIKQFRRLAYGSGDGQKKNEEKSAARGWQLSAWVVKVVKVVKVLVLVAALALVLGWGRKEE